MDVTKVKQPSSIDNLCHHMWRVTRSKHVCCLCAEGNTYPLTYENVYQYFKQIFNERLISSLCCQHKQ